MFTPTTTLGLETEMKIAVIVPMYNEAASIAATLQALVDQTLPAFTVVLCDNNSTDDTIAVAARFIAAQRLNWTIVSEPVKGTGTAADAAARAAIARGATHLARTDADCLPHPKWLERISATFADTDAQMIAGLSLPRRDDIKLSAGRYTTLVLVNELAIGVSKVLPSNRGPQFMGPYMLTAGNNMAISTDLYERVGGFTHTSIEQAHEDHELIQAVRQTTDKYVFDRRLRVYTSARRFERWGLKNTAKWYAGHFYKPDQVDIR